MATSKQLKGTVVSNAMDKTVVVEVKNYIKHSKYKKYYTKSKRYKAHDPENTCQVGDEVTIAVHRPISKDKRFIVVTA